MEVRGQELYCQESARWKSERGAGGQAAGRAGRDPAAGRPRSAEQRAQPHRRRLRGESGAQRAGSAALTGNSCSAPSKSTALLRFSSNTSERCPVSRRPSTLLSLWRPRAPLSVTASSSRARSGFSAAPRGPVSAEPGRSGPARRRPSRHNGHARDPRMVGGGSGRARPGRSRRLPAP